MSSSRENDRSPDATATEIANKINQILLTNLEAPHAAYYCAKSATHQLVTIYSGRMFASVFIKKVIVHQRHSHHYHCNHLSWHTLVVSSDIVSSTPLL